MFAKVIVDVIAKQTSRAFDYSIPSMLESWVEVGSRVAVPFGSRKVQGYVIDIYRDPTEHTQRIKPIEEVLDLIPPLTKDLIFLAKWISQTYFCYEILALQAMLPSALKAVYQKNIQINMQSPLIKLVEVAELHPLLQYVHTKETVKLANLQQKYPQDIALMKSFIDQGILIEQQHMADRLQTKKIKIAKRIIPISDLQLQMTQLPTRAIKQQEICSFFLQHHDSIAVSELFARTNSNSTALESLVNKGWISYDTIEVHRDPYADRVFIPSYPKVLTEDQQAVFHSISQQIKSYQAKVFLLHGVTGSGKTEVYLQAIQVCLDQGRQSIVLVPEISLTPQMVERFKARFGNRVAVWHSRLSAGERYDEWRKMRDAQVDIVIGARSAIFAPFQQIGLIVIDEEHEATYKQEESPKYHAREVAIYRATQNQAVVVLGSATPALESLYHTKSTEKKIEKNLSVHTEHSNHLFTTYTLLQLPQRVENRPLPQITLVDMRLELKEGHRSMFSRALHHAIELRLLKKEQIVLLLNRRGYSTFVMCRTCGFVCQCPSCEVSLTYHQVNQKIKCHYCGYEESLEVRCPQCDSTHIRHFGTGTQRVEEELSRLFPGIRVIRMDVDTTNEKGAHEKWLTKFAKQEADVLLGTQMVAKGLDFPDVTLVGVIASDSSLHIPDFRATERTFQLLTQVSGRAGRHHKPGEVIIQTYAPEHYSIQLLRDYNYATFVNQELSYRQKLNYPPYRRLILITVTHEQLPLVVKIAEAFANRLKELFINIEELKKYPIEILGPVASPLARIKDRYRFQCMVKYDNERSHGQQVLSAIEQSLHFFEQETLKQQVQIIIDVDPQYLM
jgi:primosomal protein N' (replication factor Y)